MADSFDEFDSRIARIEKGRARLKKGYSLTVDRDGLIVARARKRNRNAPLKLLVLFGAGFIGFKILLVAYLGLDTYEHRVSSLAKGTSAEQVGAWVMQADPWTVELAAKLRPYIR